MLKFKQLTLRNFLSYGNNITVINLDNPGTTLIKGENLDSSSENGSGANGVGKTVWINALSYALYDKPVSDISKERLINNINQKEMEVTVTFDDNFGNEYRIVRNRKVKGSAGGGVYLYKNEEDVTLDSIANTNALIESIVGIPHEMFVRIVVFSATHVPFLDLPTRAQADLIEGLFGVTEISERAVKLKSIIKDTEDRLNIKKAVIDQANKEQQRHNAQIEHTKQRIVAWDTQTQSTIKRLKSSLERVASIDIEQQKRLYTELQSVMSIIKATKDDLRFTKNVADGAAKQYAKYEAELAHLKDAKCPYCMQDFVGSQEKMTDLVSKMEALFADMEAATSDVKAMTLELGELTTKADELNEQLVVDDIDEMVRLASESSSIAAQIADLQVAANPHFETLEELETMTFDDINYDEVNVLTKEIEHQKFLLKLLTKNDSFVRKTILNRYLPYLNLQLDHYLSALGLPHKVEFMHNLEAKISQFDRPLDFGNLSAGQRARVNFALSLAFRDVLQRLHTKINVFMLDEVLDVGLDTVGVQAAARLVKHKARDEDLSTFIISHRDEVDGVFDRVMTVQMSQGFSYLKDDEVV